MGPEPTPTTRPVTAVWLTGGGEMGDHMRSLDWSRGAAAAGGPAAGGPAAGGPATGASAAAAVAAARGPAASARR